MCLRVLGTRVIENSTAHKQMPFSNTWAESFQQFVEKMITNWLTRVTVLTYASALDQRDVTVFNSLHDSLASNLSAIASPVVFCAHEF